MWPLLIPLIILFCLDMPLAFAVGISSIIWLLQNDSIPTIISFHRMLVSLNSFPLLAIPFFMMAGQFMSTGGVTQRLVSLAGVMVGHMRGGLAHINVLVSMFFAGITGSAVADTSAVGTLLIPAMLDEGYDKDFAVAVTSVSSVIGVIIPPSVPMIIYGITTEVSIGALLLAGLVPGAMLGAALICVNYFYAVRRGYPKHPIRPFREQLVVYRSNFLPVLAVVIIVGGIYTGIFTPTEAAVVAAIYTFILGFFVYREISLSRLPEIFRLIAITGSVGLFLLANASIFSWIIAAEQIPQQIMDWFFTLTHNKLLVLLFINILLLLVGMVLDVITATIILGPVLHPIAMAMGMDPVHFGTIVVLNLSIGLATPPVGVCLFVGCAIGKTSLSEVMPALLPFLLACLLVLALVTFIPELSTWIPNQVFSG
jgi:C4-dicarboxylate transporter DctM subunit